MALAEITPQISSCWRSEGAADRNVRAPLNSTPLKRGSGKRRYSLVSGRMFHKSMQPFIRRTPLTHQVLKSPNHIAFDIIGLMVPVVRLFPVLTVLHLLS